MPSPFPGIDPYLEGEMWQEFHETLANAIRAQLIPQIAPKYVALLDYSSPPELDAAEREWVEEMVREYRR